MPLTSHGGDVVSRAPGKLYIAGEYAVVEPGHRAVLVAVDRFITVRITPCSPAGGYAGTIRSQLYDTGSRPWRHRPQDGLAEAVGGDDDYVISAIRVVEALVAEGGGRLGSFNLGISSELDEAGIGRIVEAFAAAARRAGGGPARRRRRWPPAPVARRLPVAGPGSRWSSRPSVPCPSPGRWPPGFPPPAPWRSTGTGGELRSEVC